MIPEQQKTHYIYEFNFEEHANRRRIEQLQQLTNKSMEALREACEACAAALQEPTVIRIKNEPGR